MDFYLFIYFYYFRLDRYVHDYMVKKEMKRTAEIFAKEACIASTEVGTYGC